jgi:LacI family repressor for deo operon, udp, cdd, tsx, nupC, and nupG
MITGPTGWKSVQDRSLGYRQTLQESGLAYRSSLVEHGDWSYGSGREAMARLLAKTPQITALFVQNDRMAIGSLYALRETGRRVPDDVAVIGYDDIPVAAYCNPALTTIRQPMIDVGRVATELLIQIIEHPTTERREVLLKPELVYRETCRSS